MAEGYNLAMQQAARYETSTIELFCRHWLNSTSDETRRNFIRWNFDYFKQSPTFWLKVGTMFWITPPVVG